MHIFFTTICGSRVDEQANCLPCPDKTNSSIAEGWANQEFGIGCAQQSASPSTALWRLPIVEKSSTFLVAPIFSLIETSAEVPMF